MKRICCSKLNQFSFSFGDSKTEAKVGDDTVGLVELAEQTLFVSMEQICKVLSQSIIVPNKVWLRMSRQHPILKNG